MSKIIAFDGTSASGKGTIGRKLAEKLGYAYLDTGKLYRAVAYKYMQSGFSLTEIEVAVAETIARNLQATDMDTPDLTTEAVGAIASKVAAVTKVRQALLEYQREFAKSPQGAILDGRDIGTVICPDADVKFYITADIDVRAKRRYEQLENSGVTYDEVHADLVARDARDMRRKDAPLKKADDAIEIDSTNMDVDETLALVEQHIGSTN